MRYTSKMELERLQMTSVKRELLASRTYLMIIVHKSGKRKLLEPKEREVIWSQTTVRGNCGIFIIESELINHF